MMPKQSLETERLILRNPIPTDGPFLSELMGHEEVRRFLGGPVPLDRRGAVISSYCNAEAPDERSAVWLVEIRALHRPIGLISITKHKDGEDSELSYEFHPDIWGQGYAIEATRCALDFALNDLAFERLIAETQSANSASCNLLEKLGMTEVRRVERFGAEQSIYASQVSCKS